MNQNDFQYESTKNIDTTNVSTQEITNAVKLCDGYNTLFFTKCLASVFLIFLGLILLFGVLVVPETPALPIDNDEIYDYLIKIKDRDLWDYEVINLMERVLWNNRSDNTKVIKVDFYGINEEDDYSYDGNPQNTEIINRINLLSYSKYTVQIAEYNRKGNITKLAIIQNENNKSKNNRNIKIETKSTADEEIRAKKINDYKNFIGGILLILIFGIEFLKTLFILYKRLYKKTDFLFDVVCTCIFVLMTAINLFLTAFTNINRGVINIILYIIGTVLLIFLLVLIMICIKREKIFGDFSKSRKLIYIVNGIPFVFAVATILFFYIFIYIQTIPVTRELFTSVLNE